MITDAKLNEAYATLISHAYQIDCEFLVEKVKKLRRFHADVAQRQETNECLKKRRQ